MGSLLLCDLFCGKVPNRNIDFCIQRQRIRLERPRYRSAFRIITVPGICAAIQGTQEQRGRANICKHSAYFLLLPSTIPHGGTIHSAVGRYKPYCVNSTTSGTRGLRVHLYSNLVHQVHGKKEELGKGRDKGGRHYAGRCGKLIVGSSRYCITVQR